MNFFLKQKFWFFIAVFFIVVNITLLVCLWHNTSKHKRHDGNRNKYDMHQNRGGRMQVEFNLSDYLAEQLGFSAEQKQKLMAVNTSMDVLKDSLSEQNEIS